MQNQFYYYIPAMWLELYGVDTLEFLQGQFTNDLRGDSANLCTYGLWLDRRGKVQGDGFVLRMEGDTIRIFSYESTGAALLERLERFIIADDVEILDRTDSVEAVSVLGPDVGAIATRLGGVPPSGGCVRTEIGWVFGGRRASENSLEVVFERNRAGEVKERLRDFDLAQMGSREIEMERIRSGIPAVPRELGPDDLPQEGGLAEAAISFNKGCYIGQEVMARLQSMGRVRRRLVDVCVTGEASLPCALFLGDDRVGELRTLLSEPVDGVNGRAMLRGELTDGRLVAMNFEGESAPRIFAGTAELSPPAVETGEFD